MINILTRTRQENHYLNDFNESYTLKSFYNVASIYFRVLIFHFYKTTCHLVSMHICVNYESSVTNEKGRTGNCSEKVKLTFNIYSSFDMLKLL